MRALVLQLVHRGYVIILYCIHNTPAINYIINDFKDTFDNVQFHYNNNNDNNKIYV